MLEPIYKELTHKYTSYIDCISQFVVFYLANMMCTSWTTLLTLTSLLALTYADTPANCTYEDVRGTWGLSMTEVRVLNMWFLHMSFYINSYNKYGHKHRYVLLWKKFVRGGNCKKNLFKTLIDGIYDRSYLLSIFFSHLWLLVVTWFRSKVKYVWDSFTPLRLHDNIHGVEQFYVLSVSTFYCMSLLLKIQMYNTYWNVVNCHGVMNTSNKTGKKSKKNCTKLVFSSI